MNIGVFDSGLGGLTVVKTMLNHLSGANIYYIADTKNAPYGEKTKEQILDFSIKITDYFISNYNIDALVVACNTATSAAIIELREKYPNLIIVGTEPGLRPAISHSHTKEVGVLATPATLNGEKYQILRDELSSEFKANIHERACHGLVQQIELGELDTPKTIDMLKVWLTPMRDAGVDTIVLGCTHYPLIGVSIKKIMGQNISLIETSEPISKRLIQLLNEKNISLSGENNLSLFATGKIESGMIEKILGKKITIERVVL